ncbi:MAG: AAA family ATPase [Mycolicibacterium neoaurum]
MTGGFLAGLDVRFEEGLNVVIGARGSGKTTLLELMGHALGTPHADKKRHEHETKRIRSMLGDGEVVMDVEDRDSSYRLIVDAEGGGRRPEFAVNALVLGQNELETIASDPDSRLRLIDFRAKVEPSSLASDEIEVSTRQLSELRREMEELRDRTDVETLLKSDLDGLIAEENEMMTNASASLTARREILRTLENSLLLLQTQQAESAYARDQLQELANNFALAVNDAERLLRVSIPAEDEEFIRPRLQRFHHSAAELTEELSTSVTKLNASHQSRAQLELELRSQAEPIRQELNEAERGLGELTSRIRRVKAELERVEVEKARLAELARRYATIRDERERLLDSAERAREELYQVRLDVATNVSRDLSSRITVTIEHLADTRTFRNFLSSSLQGSGLKYASIADSLARNVLPRQLLNYIENGDVASAAAVAELPVERMGRVLERLDSADLLSELSMISLDDMADFLLMDGTELKSVDTLSTGQKCAVTLPILLTEHTRTLLLDQPEDHLDNAFLVDSVLVGLNRRSAAGAQTIVATHNANIPVLGSAVCVIRLTSDGRRGSVATVGAYSDLQVVDAITSLMEGGEDAFRRRAAFYRDHGIST